MTDLEQDLLIAQAEVRGLKARLIERGCQLGKAVQREKLLAEELAALRTDISVACEEIENICRNGRSDSEEITRWVLTLKKLIDQGK